jgi:hypothetical protein
MQVAHAQLDLPDVNVLTSYDPKVKIRGLWSIVMLGSFVCKGKVTWTCVRETHYKFYLYRSTENYLIHIIFTIQHLLPIPHFKTSQHDRITFFK